MWSTTKKAFVLLLVSCVVCSSVWALPGNNQKRSTEVSVKAELHEPIYQTVSEEQEILQESSETKSPIYEAVEETVTVSKADLEEVVAIVEELVAVIEEANAEADIVAEAASVVDRAYNLGFVADQDFTKLFTKVEYLVGFSGGIPKWGFGTEMGFKIGNGFIVSAEANYMVGGFTMDTAIEPWNIDKLTFSIGFGWEW